MRAGEYSGDSGVHYVEADWNPLCPFGYGLTYTTFVCSDLQIEGGSLSACEVEEEGGAGMRVLHCYEQRGCFGEETAQVYLRDMVSGTVKPVKERAGFAKIALQQGESSSVEILVGRCQMRTLSRQYEWHVEPSGFQVMVGDNAANALLTGQFTIC